MPPAGHSSKRVKLGQDIAAPTKPQAADNAVLDADDLDFSTDIKGLMSAITAFKEKAASDVKQKNETIITSLSSEVKKMLQEAKETASKERQAFVKAVSKMCKETEANLKREGSKVQALQEKFAEEGKAHAQAYEDIISKFEEQKQKLIVKIEQQRKKDKSTLLELQKTCSEKLAKAETLLKKRKQEEKSIDYLQKTLGSFFNTVDSDDETPEE